MSERDKESERKIKNIVQVNREVRLDYKWKGTSGTDTNKMFQKNPPCSQTFCLSPDVIYVFKFSCYFLSDTFVQPEVSSRSQPARQWF